IPPEFGIGNLELEEICLRHGDIDELLPQLIVGEALDLPAHRLRRVLRLRITRTEHHERWPPPATERVLRHAPLRLGTARERHHDLEALALVKALLLADAHHRARIRPVRTTADRNLVYDRRAIDEPTDRSDIRPGRRRIVEDAGVLCGT